MNKQTVITIASILGIALGLVLFFGAGTISNQLRAMTDHELLMTIAIFTGFNLLKG